MRVTRGHLCHLLCWGARRRCGWSGRVPRTLLWLHFDTILGALADVPDPPLRPNLEDGAGFY